jgi:hypothetical protein
MWITQRDGIKQDGLENLIQACILIHKIGIFIILEKTKCKNTKISFGFPSQLMVPPIIWRLKQINSTEMGGLNLKHFVSFNWIEFIGLFILYALQKCFYILKIF